MNSRELQTLLDDTATRLGVVGAQLALYDGGEAREFVTGHRNPELGLTVTADTLFQIGSTTKVFNAALILSLVDTGVLDLDAPVRQYICDFKLADPEAQCSITLRQLLSMSAGLDNGPYYDYGRGEGAIGRYVDAISGMPQIFSPGSAYGYSNASTTVAGLAAARVTGREWEALLKARVLDPLGLKQSATFAEDLLFHPVALGYRRRVAGSPLERMPIWSYPRSQAPAGILCCSAGDLIKFARMFLDDGTSVEGHRVLSGASIEAMQRPQIKLPTQLTAEEWCLGPFRKRWDGHVLYGHSGTNLSGSSMLLWCPQKKIAIATVVNVPDHGYPLADALFDVIFPQVFGIKKPVAATPENVTAVPTDLRPYAGRFEAFGMVQTFEVKDQTLLLTSRIPALPQFDVQGCELIPLGEGRFLPCDLRVSGNRGNWDMAFWGRDDGGRATHLLQGIFPLRRTG